MRNLATTLLLGVFLAGWTLDAFAQITEREDVVWARFIEGEAPTIDGQIDEAVWDEAEEIVIEYGDTDVLPGGGWWFGRDGSSANPNLEEPTDPPKGTFLFLAKGDSLYIAGMIEDASIGGSRGLWDFDAVFLPIRDKSAFGPSGDGFHWFNTSSPEMMLGWWNAIDTTDAGLPAVGIDPYPHTNIEAFGWRNDRRVDNVFNRPERTEEQRTNWEIATVLNGTANDDTHGADVGWAFEMKINLAELGYDLDDSDGAVVEMGLAIQDADFWWPTDVDKGATSRAWFQAPFANSFAGDRSGSLKVYTDPDVTVDTATLPDVGPDYIVPSAENFDAPTIDGSLDEDVWAETNAVLQIQYKNEELIGSLPEPIRYQSGWFRPNASQEVEVIDPSLATVKWFFKDNMLYVGIDVEDQAVDLEEGEAGDGFRFSISDLDAVHELGNNLTNREFIVTVDADGEARLEGYFADLIQEGMEASFDVALSMKATGSGTSTPGDPSDVDAGYQIEMALDLEAILGYPADPAGNLIFVGFNLFDSDEFEDETLNYRTVTWRFRERANGPGAVVRLDADAQVAIDGTGEVPERIQLFSNYPNPFNPSTTLRYALPTAGEVTVQVFDVLGRLVGRLAPGMQSAGQHQYRFEATGLASGVYLYRVEVKDATGHVRQSAVGRMLLVK